MSYFDDQDQVETNKLTQAITVQQTGDNRFITRHNGVHYGTVFRQPHGFLLVKAETTPAGVCGNFSEAQIDAVKLFIVRKIVNLERL